MFLANMTPLMLAGRGQLPPCMAAGPLRALQRLLNVNPGTFVACTSVHAMYHMRQPSIWSTCDIVALLILKPCHPHDA